MQVADHGGCLQQGVPDFFIAAPSASDGEGNVVEVKETVTAGAGRHTVCFAHVANCCDRAFEHMLLLAAIEVIEPVGVADELGNGTVDYSSLFLNFRGFSGSIIQGVHHAGLSFRIVGGRERKSGVECRLCRLGLSVRRLTESNVPSVCYARFPGVFSATSAAHHRSGSADAGECPPMSRGRR